MKRILTLIACLILTACAAQHSLVLKETTVLDQTTGLVWAKNANMPGKPLEWRGDDNVYAFILKLNSGNYAGYADWRVPTKNEMESLIRYAKSLGYVADRYETWPYQKLRQAGFSDVRDYDYWTSTRKSPQEMWVADLAKGEVQPKPENKPYCLWPVRGSSLKP